jgi:hypothetical protein
MKKYEIRLCGCDDYTCFEMELDDNQLKLVKEMCEKSIEVADTCNSLLMPIMKVDKCETIIETDLIGALQLHRDGKANRFRVHGTLGWFLSPITLAYYKLSNPPSLASYQEIIQCKKENENANTY